MNVGRNIVFSKRPDGVSDEGFNTRPHEHIPESLAVSGFVGAPRYRIETVIGGAEAAAPWDYIPVFEIDGDRVAAIAEQKKAGLNSKESYVKLQSEEGNGPALPESRDDGQFASSNCVALGDRVESEG
jgi:hypothetical protein